jgi:hypothetical protein
MRNSFSTSLNRIVERSLAIFHNVISPQQLTHRLGWGYDGDARVDGCRD